MYKIVTADFRRKLLFGSQNGIFDELMINIRKKEKIIAFTLVFVIISHEVLQYLVTTR